MVDSCAKFITIVAIFEWFASLVSVTILLKLYPLLWSHRLAILFIWYGYLFFNALLVGIIFSLLCVAIMSYLHGWTVGMRYYVLYEPGT
jgi:hypothetical protein